MEHTIDEDHIIDIEVYGLYEDFFIFYEDENDYNYEDEEDEDEEDEDEEDEEDEYI